MEHSWKGNTNQEDVRDRQRSEEEETNKQEEYRECLKLWNFLWFWNMGFIHYTLPQPLSQCTTPRPSLAISREPRARVFVFNLFCSTMLEPWPSHMINKFSITHCIPNPLLCFLLWDAVSSYLDWPWTHSVARLSFSFDPPASGSWVWDYQSIPMCYFSVDSLIVTNVPLWFVNAKSRSWESAFRIKVLSMAPHSKNLKLL